MARRGGDWNRCLYCKEVTKNKSYCSVEHLKLHTTQQPVRIYVDQDGIRVLASLDITRAQLSAYRKHHPVCEICGRAEAALTQKLHDRPNQLALDHCHNKLKFRGLLCSVCNRQLGWYERNKERIEAYLNKPL